MEFKLYRCAHCGNIAFKVVDKGVPLVCCGQKMEEMVPNTTDAATEKHVPAIEMKPHAHNAQIATIKVGSVEHPMVPEHWIQFIAATTGNTLTVKYLEPGETPEMKVLTKDGNVTAYELCNLHGYWVGK